MSASSGTSTRNGRTELSVGCSTAVMLPSPLFGTGEVVDRATRASVVTNRARHGQRFRDAAHTSPHEEGATRVEVLAGNAKRRCNPSSLGSSD